MSQFQPKTVELNDARRLLIGAPGETVSGGAERERIERLEELLGPDVCRRLGVFAIPEGFRLSVVIPCYNEAKTIEEVLRRVSRADVPLEIIVVDDGSSDGTRERLTAWQAEADAAGVDYRVIIHPRNQGKGAALKTGFLEAAGDVVIVQDADLEYDPADFRRLIQPILFGAADVVYGSRFQGEGGRSLRFWHSLANQVLTLASNMFTGLRLSDMETCYKVFRREIIAEIAPTIRERRFGVEPELTAKVARVPGVRVYELPISYAARGYADGKKIGWRDGVRALYCIVRYWWAP